MKELTEEWLPIPGYEGRYSVSNHGDVMSMNYQRTNLLKIMRPDKNRRGYLAVGLHSGGKETRKRWFVHQLVLLAFVGPRPKGMQINHKNGVKADNSLSNLEYCTPSQNAQHACDTGLQLPIYGEKNRQAKLTSAQVIEIRTKVANGAQQKLIAKEYGVSRATICLIVNDQRWAHLQ